MIQRLLLTGILSGLMAGVLVTLVHLIVVSPLILEAERYEQSVAAAPQHGDGIDHRTGESAMHEHGSAWSPEDGLERGLYTLMADLVMGVGFGLLLAAGYTLYGATVRLSDGAVWGLGGFLSFTFLPGLGLPPELPASAAADLFARQTWWLATAAASVAGLALIAFVRSRQWKALGVVLLILPHVVGAPQIPTGEIGAAPPELAAHFVMFSLFASAVMWLVLGVASAYFFERLAPATRGSVVNLEA